MHVISAISAGSVVRANFQSTPRRNAATRSRGARSATRASSGDEQSDGSILFTFGKDPLGALFPKREPREGLFDKEPANPAANAFKNEVDDREDAALKRQYGGGIMEKLLPKREPHDGLAGPKK